MINRLEKQHKKETVRRRLVALRENGFPFVETHDDGSSWVGSRTGGVEIDELLLTSFVGNVVLECESGIPSQDP